MDSTEYETYKTYAKAAMDADADDEYIYNQSLAYDGYAIKIVSSHDNVCLIDENNTLSGVICAEFWGSVHTHVLPTKSDLLNSAYTY